MRGNCDEVTPTLKLNKVKIEDLVPSSRQTPNFDRELARLLVVSSTLGHAHNDDASVWSDTSIYSKVPYKKTTEHEFRARLR